jgi:hypothetical protein
MDVEETVVDQFNVLSWHLLGGTEDNKQNLTQESVVLGQDLYPVLPIIRIRNGDRDTGCLY